MVYIRYISLVSLVCFLSTACTSSVVQSPQDSAPVGQGYIPEDVPDDSVYPDKSAPVEDRKPPAEASAGKPVQHKASQAVIALLYDADHYVAAGKHQQAEATLERALRIDPKNPLLWHKLGRLHLQQGEWQQAIAMAKKSNVLAQGDQRLQADNWLVIAHAKKALGDKQGASQAMNTVEQLREGN